MGSRQILRTRYSLRRAGTAWTLTVPAPITGTVGVETAYVHDAKFDCHVRSASMSGVPELVYRPANAAARKLLHRHLAAPVDDLASGQEQG